MATFQIEYPVIFAAALVNVVLTALWFSQVMFGQQWSAAVRRSGAGADSVGALPKVLNSFVGSIVMGMCLAVIIGWARADTVLHGALVGLFTGIGLVSTTAYTNHVLAGGQRRIFIINNGRDIVSLVVMGAILGGWG